MASSAGAVRLVRRSFARLARASFARRRVAILLCLVSIGSCFAAAAAIQMRLDRAHALGQAAFFEKRRALDIAAVAAAALDRFAEAGRTFARNQSVSLPDGVTSIALFDLNGARERVTPAGVGDVPAPVLSEAARGPVLSGHVLAFPDASNIVAIQFDPHALVPSRMLDDAAVLDTRGALLTGEQSTSGRLAARAGSWPIFAQTYVDEDAALAAWRGALPLYLFVILGPALAAACLAPLLVGAFEERLRARRAVKTLRAARPQERSLLVRLAAAERRAHEGVRAKSEFIAHMSHELRTPLNAVIGFAEVIEKQLYGPEGHAKYIEYARDIATAGRGLHARIGDILEYANIEAGRHAITLEAIDLAPLARTLLAEHEGRAFARRIALELVAEGPSAAMADRWATRRALSLLIVNALAYARDGGRVRVELRAERQAVIIVVRDIGIGFSADEKHKAAEAFVSFERRGRAGGAGLGLAIATALVRRMGGALAIGGYHGLGATIELRLPPA